MTQDTKIKEVGHTADAVALLKAIIRHGELANIDKGGSYWSGGKKPPTMDAWAFPRHMLTDIEAAIAATEGRAS